MTQGRTLLNGRFALGDAIGRGTFGSVYRGLDTVTGESVAIKLLTAAGAGTGRLQSEATLLQKLCHPCIVSLHGAGTEKGTPFLVTDLVEGGSLRDLLLREHRLPITRALEIAIDLADALRHAHENGVVHRDVKPANVLLASDGTPRLADFGVAAVHDPASGGLTRELIGTLAYLSPEGFRGEPQGPESDLWSLGLVLFEMLAGSLPFGDPATEAELPGLMSRPAPLVSELRPETPDAMVSLLCSMLEGDRVARIGDAGAVARSLEEILAGLQAPKEAESVTNVGLGGLRALETPFLGREQEQAELFSLLMGGGHRLVCLVGPGGIGKTRLAWETARQAAETFPDGVHLVALAPIPSPSLMVPAIAGAVGLTFRGTADPKDQLLGFLSHRRMLLVMDNMEHLLDGAGLIGEILAAAHGVALLVTSRERVGLPLETAVEIHGLAVPSPTDAFDPANYAALLLFRHAAERTSRGFDPQSADWESIAAICRLVDGNPLGIELAAVSIEQLPCAAIAMRLSEGVDVLTAASAGVPPRHRSMRAVLDHSWNLLRESERGCYRRMAVFRGGFTLEAARAVAGASLATLLSLERKSMLAQGSPGRYGMHELLRKYAEQELALHPRESAEAEGLHADYYGAFVREREDALSAAKDRMAYLEIETELANIRAGWACAQREGNGGLLLRYLRGMHRFFDFRSRSREGEAAFRETVAVLRETGSPHPLDQQALAVALACLSTSLHRLARFAESGATAREAYALATSLSLDSEAAAAASAVGNAALATGDVLVARDFISRALATWETTGNLMGEGACHANLGLMESRRGDVQGAAAHYQRALAVFRAIGHTYGAAVVLQNLASMALQRCAFDEARQCAEEGLRQARLVGNREIEARLLSTLGIVAHRLNDEDAAIRRYEESLILKRELGDRQGVSNTLSHLGVSWSSLGRADRAEAAFAEAHAHAEAVGDRHTQAMALMFQADHCMKEGDLAEAQRCYRGAISLALATGALPQLTEIVRAVACLKRRLGAQEKALEAFAVGLAQPFYEKAKDEIKEAIAEIEKSLSPEIVERAHAAAGQSLIEFAKALLAEPDWG